MSGVPAWAVRGAKVVCVEDRRWLFDVEGHDYIRDPTVLVERGKVYTVECAHIAPDGNACVLLAGVPSRGLGEYGYCVRRFRPAIEPKTEAEDLAHFRKYLHQNVPEAVE